MRQAVMTSPGNIEFKNIIDPKPGKGEVLIRIKRIGVCGSDVHVWHGKHPYTSYPVIQGHEFSAIIEELGEEVNDLKVGMKVTAIPQIFCGKCSPCRRGDYHICENLKVQGFQAPGVAQDLFVTDAKKIVPLPEDFSFDKGAFVEPVSVAVHAINKVGNIKGKNVVVLGAGPIGNLIAQAALSNGANVLITDISDYRLDLARKCRIKNTLNSKSESFQSGIKKIFGENGIQVAIECVGIESTISQAVDNIEKGGTIIVVGVFTTKVKIDLGLVQDRELKIFGSLMYKHEDYLEAVKLLSKNKIVTEPLFSQHYHFEDYNDAYRFIDKYREETMKVFIDL